VELQPAEGPAGPPAALPPERHAGLTVLFGLAVLAALVGAWPGGAVLLVIVFLRSRDYASTLRDDDRAVGPRPGRCVALRQVWVGEDVARATSLARDAIDRVDPRRVPRPVPDGRVAARLARDRGSHPPQLVDVWVTPSAGGADLVVEVRPRRGSQLYDRGASATTAERITGEIAELAESSGTPLRPSPSPVPDVVERVGWRWWHVAIAIALFRFAAYPFVWLDDALGRPLVRGGALVVGQLWLWGVVVGWLWVVSVRRGSGSFRRDYGLRFRWPEDLYIGVPCGIGILVVQSIVVAVLTALAGVQAASTAAPVIDARRGHWLSLWPILLIVVVGAPLVEETVFRGLTLLGAERRLTVPWSVVVSGLLFGALHWNVRYGVVANVVLVTALGVSGMLLGAVAAATRRLGSSMVCHGTLNLVISIVILVTYH